MLLMLRRRATPGQRRTHAVTQHRLFALTKAGANRLEYSPSSGAIVLQTVDRNRSRARAVYISVALAALLAAATGVSAPVAGQDAPRGWLHVATWQSDPSPPLGVIVDPVDITRASDNTLVVTDRRLHRVQRFTPDGEPLTKFGRRGRGEGELSFPRGAAADPRRDRVYVADTDNNRISVFDLAGNFIAHWPAPPVPMGVAVATGGNIFVSGDAGTVWVYSPEGAPFAMAEVGDVYVEEGDTSGGLAAMRLGDVYAAGTGGAIRLSPVGLSRGLNLFLNRQVGSARDIAIDDGEDLYALAGPSRIYRVLPGGYVPDTHLGGHIMAIAGGPKKTMYKAVAATRDERSYIAKVVFGATDLVTNRWGDPLTILGWMAAPLRLASGANGDIYTVDELFRVQRFASDGTAIGQVTLPGLKEAAVGPDGDLYVARERSGTSAADPDDPDLPPMGVHRLLVERYHFAGGLVSSRAQPTVGTVVWSRSWQESSDSLVLSRFATLVLDAPAGRVLALDAGRRRVLAYSLEGDELPAIELAERRAGVPEYTDMGVSADGRLFVLHTADRRIIQLDPSGGVVAEWDAPDWAWRLDVFPDGRVAVVTATRWLWVFDVNGRPETALPLPRSAFDEGEPPSDIVVGSDGRIYVTDRSGSAVFVFAPTDVASETPPGGRYGCAVNTAASAEPGAAEVGEAFTVRLTLAGSCDEHPRSGRRPGTLLRTLELEVTVPPDLEPEVGSLEPPGTIDGRALTWRMTDVSLSGTAVSFRLRSSEPGRRPAFQQASATFMDGWLNPGVAEVDAPHLLVRQAVGPVARLFVPALRSR